MSRALQFLLAAGLSYLWGSIVWGYVIARLRGVAGFGERDLPGGAGSIRQMGFVWGALVGLLDIAKAAVAVRLAETLQDPWAVGAAALGTVLGHCWPVFFGFRGGLTVSGVMGTALGLGLYLPLAVGFFLGGLATGVGEAARRARGRLPLFTSPAALGGTVGHLALLLATLLLGSGPQAPEAATVFALQGLVGIVRGFQVRRAGAARLFTLSAFDGDQRPADPSGSA